MDERLRSLERSLHTQRSAAALMELFRAHQRLQRPFDILNLEFVDDLDNVPKDLFLNALTEIKIGNKSEGDLTALIDPLLNVFAASERVSPGLYYLQYVPQQWIDGYRNLSGYIGFSLIYPETPNLLIVCGVDDLYYVAHGGYSTTYQLLPADDPENKGTGPEINALCRAARASHHNTTNHLSNLQFEDDNWNHEVASFYKKLPGFILYSLATPGPTEEPAQFLVDYFYSIEHFKHLAYHLLRIFINDPVMVDHIAEQMEVDSSYIMQTCRESQAEEWGDWNLQDANKLHFRLPRLIDEYAALDAYPVINNCDETCTTLYGAFQDVEHVQEVIREAMDYWEIIKRAVPPQAAPPIL